MSSMPLDAARDLHRRGDLGAAVAAYQTLIEADDATPEVWHLKAMAEHQLALLGEARKSVAHAIAVGGERPEYLLLEGMILHDLGEFAEAEGRFAKATLESPTSAAAHLELGRVQMDMDKPQEALKAFQAAVNLQPKLARAWNNLGIALQSLDRLDEAVRAFNYSITLEPGYALAHFNLARIFNLRGDTKRALEHAVFAVQADRRHVEAWLLVGDIHRRNRETSKALAAFSGAAQADPSNPKPRVALADLVGEAGGYENARAEYRRIWREFPDNLKAALGATLSLPHVYESVEQLEAVRRQYADGLERLHDAAVNFRFPQPERDLSSAAWTNFFLAYQGKDDRALQERYGQFVRRILEPSVPDFFAPRAGRAGGERIRVGFLSHFFFNCTAGRYFSSWVTRLDPRRFETFVYYTNEWVADDTRTMARAASRFRHLPGRPLATLAKTVIGDRLDVLVYPELGMHSDTFTLAALRLAPVQVAGWGHPNTTGQPEIDWFLSSEPMEPSDAQRYYSEKLAFLPGLGSHYMTPSTDVRDTRTDFGLPEDRTLYLVPQSLFKIHPDNDELIARVLERDPNGAVVIFGSHHQAWTDVFATRLAACFERHALDIHARTCFLAPFMPHARYLRLNQLCDVMIDTMHWSGGNTSLDALAMGLPVVTQPGTFMRGRQSQAMLHILGVPELVVADLDAHVDTVVRLGRDRDQREALRERILANRPLLFERDEPIRALEDFLERAVRG